MSDNLNDTNNSDTSEKQKEVSKEFTIKVVEWVKMDNALRELRAKSKEITDEKKDLEGWILSYLDQIGEKTISIGDGNLRKNVSKTKAPLKKETIHSTIKDITKDDAKASLITQQIFENRPMTERINLKRTKNRGPKKTNENV
ncbi:hypothetical protein crov226 [Cafeteria roenbergensis virus]|uniref:Uncharacterized protein n=1 Tax=Cafeteria roenbergensis virus (strain BV-PW1) TaxID=693272 RepID=E3T4Z6_CROVB|nr:hypothetical protein crov226 [Cafeteria roenbergensis virus BV-PW1]ADO67259.1 hypothetical protein crov226 [Cafeteria roenbergensis virus BV-PW1]